MSDTAMAALVVLTSDGALRQAVASAAPAAPVTMAETPLEALWAMAQQPALALLAEERCLAFRHEPFLRAARQARPAARLIVMARPEEEVHLGAVAGLADELAVGPVEVERAVSRLMGASAAAKGDGGSSSHPHPPAEAGNLPHQGGGVKDAGVPGRWRAASADEAGGADDSDARHDLTAASAACLKEMLQRMPAGSGEKSAGRLCEAICGLSAVRAAALLSLAEGQPRLLGKAGEGLSVDEAIGAERANGDRSWASVGRRLWLMPVDVDTGPAVGLLVLLSGDVDEAAALDALETPALLAAQLVETARRREAALRMMTLDGDSHLHRRGYLEPYIDALCRAARERRREVLLVVARINGAAETERLRPGHDLQRVGSWVARRVNGACVGRWDDMTVVAAAPVRDNRQVQLTQQLLQREKNELSQAEISCAVFPWDGDTASALVSAASSA